MSAILKALGELTDMNCEDLKVDDIVACQLLHYYVNHKIMPSDALAEFIGLCWTHDLSHMMSDDARYWRKGEQELAKILDVSFKLPIDLVVRVWNDAVDFKVVAEYRTPWYKSKKDWLAWQGCKE